MILWDLNESYEFFVSLSLPFLREKGNEEDDDEEEDDDDEVEGEEENQQV